MVRTHQITTRNDYRSKHGWYDWPAHDDDGADGPTPSVVARDLYEGGDGGGEVGMLEDIVCLTDWLEDITPKIVFRARQSGQSWSQIGQALGITKQAAQQRFAEECAREAARLAAEQAGTEAYEEYLEAEANPEPTDADYADMHAQALIDEQRGK